jgi:hypothetical protein
MGAVEGKNTPATELAFDRVTELLLADEIDVPNRSTFVPADLPGFDKVMANALRKDKPIVIVYPDGSEQVIERAEVRAAAQPR